jgi:hypothetical protein
MDGIIILALKKTSYYYSAFNLAVSIKHFNPEINITLLSDGGHKPHFLSYCYSVFDQIKEIALCDYIDKDGSFQPGLAKISLYKYTPYDNTLYIDADSLCLQDARPVIEHCKSKGGFIYSNVIGSGGYKDDIMYNVWGKNEFQYPYFDIPLDHTLNTINSSWLFIKKSDEAKNFFTELRTYWDKGFGLENLRNKWGNGTYPDELFFNGVMAKNKIDPKIDLPVMFMGNEYVKETNTQIAERYHFITMYGVGKGNTTVKPRYQEWYDHLCFVYFEKIKLPFRFKVDKVMKGKHINK